ncbi:hypothetical protein CAEBREN_28258 [Caenorhabditis brenneri]|uniref:Uncharacterized protein n=1 Tax=Caenorhabditis brenneri TaxID=135651 RepID=G0MUT1_CAEBE|nr:hypothetical protein CAEBREN_28258 [Caenorhabditis brenneri]
MDDFYLTLPSTTPNLTAKNTSSVYTTRLPQVLTLEKDKWVVAATDIIYPYSYKNVNKVLKFYIHFKDGRRPICYNLPANQYKTIDQVLAILNAKTRKRRNAELANAFQKALDEDVATKMKNALAGNEQTVETEGNIITNVDPTPGSIVFPVPQEETRPAAVHVVTDEGMTTVTPVPISTRPNDEEDDDEQDDEEDDDADENDDETDDDEKDVGSNTLDKGLMTESNPSPIKPPVVESKDKDEANQLRDAFIAGVNELIVEQLKKLVDVQELEAEKREQFYQSMVTNQEIIANAFKQANDPEKLSAALDKLKEEQTKVLTGLAEKSEDISNSFARSVENAIARQLVHRPKSEYKALIKVVDETRLEQLSTLREVMQPMTVASISNLLQFNMENDLLRLTFKSSDIAFVEFDKECAYFLGFHNCIVRDNTLASSSIDFFGNITTLYVYCDIVDQSIVGNYKSSLLTVVPCKGKFGEMVQHTFPVPRYLPLMNSTIDSIKVSILTLHNAFLKNGPWEFILTANSRNYLNLKKTWMVFTFKITGENGAAIAETDKALYAPINNIAHSIVKNFTVHINSQLVYHNSMNYAYKSYFENLLMYNKEQKNSTLSVSGYAHDDIIDNKESHGFKTRAAWVKDGKSLQVAANISIDLTNQPRVLLNNCNFKLTVYPNSDEFLIDNYEDSGIKYELHIEDVHCRVNELELADGLANEIEAALIEHKFFQYPLISSQVRSFYIGEGRNDAPANTLFTSKMPRRIFMGLVSAAAYSGDYNLSPFNFKPHGIRDVHIDFCGVTLPGRPMNLDFSKGKCVEPYLMLQEALGHNRNNTTCNSNLIKL